MESIFSAIPQQGKLVFLNIYDLERYCMENDGIELHISIKHASKLSEKMRMFAYLFGPLMDTAVRGFTRQGWVGMDKVKARYELQSMFCKEEMYNALTGETKVYLIELSSMPKARLLKFIQDIIIFMEQELEVEAPDSETYKMMKLKERITKPKQ